MSSPINRLLDQVQWTRLMWPEDVEPWQVWTNKRTGQYVRVVEVDADNAYVLKEYPPPVRTWRISRVGLVKRYTVDQTTLRDELRYPPPPPNR